MLSFLFVEEGKLFIKKSSFEEFNLVFFTTERMVCFEMQPRQWSFCWIFRYILHSMAKTTTFLKRNLCVFKCFIDVLVAVAVVVAKAPYSKFNMRCSKPHYSFHISFNFLSVGKLSGIDSKGLYLSSQKEKENFCLVFMTSIKHCCKSAATVKKRPKSVFVLLN